jgi:hypothetical protein
MVRIYDIFVSSIYDILMGLAFLRRVTMYGTREVLERTEQGAFKKLSRLLFQIIKEILSPSKTETNELSKLL